MRRDPMTAVERGASFLDAEAARMLEKTAPSGDLESATQAVSDAITKARAGDCGAVYEAGAVEALRLIRQSSQAEFMRLRSAIKAAHKDLRISALDAAIRGDSEGGGEDRQTADLLADLARERCEFFHDPDREPYATFTNTGHRECWHVMSVGFTEWLSFRFYREHGRAPSELAIKTALLTLAGQAKFEGDTRPVALRVANHGGAIWLDLADSEWRAVEVTATGWRLATDPPVMFTRTASMKPLPCPTHGGKLADLWGVVNVPESDRLIVLAWLLECLRTETPYAVLELVGEQGSAKSSTQCYLRELIDPNQANNRAAPKCVEDVFVSAKNAHLMSFENLSHLRPEYQDALCILATGGGFATRKLYTNADDVVLNLKRPVALNGISVVVTAQDLLDRTVHIDLPAIEARLTATELARRFDEKRAGILGGLLDLFVKVLRMLPTVSIAPEDLPRMADFAMLGEAVYRAHGRKAGEFLIDYAERRKDGVHRTLEASPVAVAALAWLEERPDGFDGTVKGLHDVLTKHRPEGETWPRTPKGFADAFRRIAPGLRMIDVHARISDRPGKHGYGCVLKRMPEPVNGKAWRGIPSQTVKLPSDVHHVHEVHRHGGDDGGKGERGELGEPVPRVPPREKVYRPTAEAGSIEADL